VAQGKWLIAECDRKPAKFPYKDESCPRRTSADIRAIERVSEQFTNALKRPRLLRAVVRRHLIAEANAVAFTTTIRAKKATTITVTDRRSLMVSLRLCCVGRKINRTSRAAGLDISF
jgi:hypothetical protein